MQLHAQFLIVPVYISGNSNVACQTQHFDFHFRLGDRGRKEKTVKLDSRLAESEEWATDCKTLEGVLRRKA